MANARRFCWAFVMLCAVSVLALLGRPYISESAKALHSEYNRIDVLSYQPTQLISLKADLEYYYYFITRDLKSQKAAIKTANKLLKSISRVNFIGRKTLNELNFEHFVISYKNHKKRKLLVSEDNWLGTLEKGKFRKLIRADYLKIQKNPSGFARSLIKHGVPKLPILVKQETSSLGKFLSISIKKSKSCEGLYFQHCGQISLILAPVAKKGSAQEDVHLYEIMVNPAAQYIAANSSIDQVKPSSSEDPNSAADTNPTPSNISNPEVINTNPTLSPTASPEHATLNPSASPTASPNRPVASNSTRIAAQIDFDQDGKLDLLWQSDRGAIICYLSSIGKNKILFSDIQNPTLQAWRLAVATDINQDGHTDLLLQSDAGSVHAWLMQGTTLLNQAVIVDANKLPAIAAWKLMAAADFNQDGKTDLVWQNSASGEVNIYLMDGTKPNQNLRVPGTETNPALAYWRLAAAVDVNKDGNTDLLFQDLSGKLASWNLDKNLNSINNTAFFPEKDLSNLRLTHVTDWDKNGSLDFVWQDLTNANAQVSLMNEQSLIKTEVLVDSSKHSELLDAGLMGMNACTAGSFPGVEIKPLQIRTSAAINISSPLEASIYQRAKDNHAVLTVAGSATQGQAVFLRIRAAGGTVIARHCIRISALNSNRNNFAANLHVPAGGWHIVEAELLRKDGTSAITSSGYFGVGELFLAAGQSNSANGAQKTGFPAPIFVRTFNPWTGKWSEAHGPLKPATGEEDSPWPYFGKLLSDSIGVPVGIISVGVGSTTIENWQPDVYASYYPLLTTAIQASKVYGGVRAILWHQGEANAGANWTPAYTVDNYINSFAQIKSRLNLDTNSNLNWFVARASFVPLLTTAPCTSVKYNEWASAVVTQAQEAIWARGLAYPGPNTDQWVGSAYRWEDPNYGLCIHMNAAGVLQHGSAWAEKVYNVIVQTQ